MKLPREKLPGELTIKLPTEKLPMRSFFQYEKLSREITEICKLQVSKRNYKS